MVGIPVPRQLFSEENKFQELNGVKQHQDSNTQANFINGHDIGTRRYTDVN